MQLTAKDVSATVLTALVVLTFAATHQGWNVWLIGGSHRWAAGTIGILGMATCSLGEKGKGAMVRLLAVLGTIALALFVWAIVTGSLTPLSLLVVDIVLLWVASTVRHLAGGAPVGHPRVA
jgi:hypothetical protein